MKRQIRYGVYETNSSSTHVMTICTQKEFNDWKDGKLILDYNKFVPAPEKISEEEKEGIVKNYYDNVIKPKSKFIKEYHELSSEEKKEIREMAEEEDWFEPHEGLETYDDWYNDEYLETYEESYTTEHGDKIVVFGKYGNDY